MAADIFLWDGFSELCEVNSGGENNEKQKIIVGVTETTTKPGITGNKMVGAADNTKKFSPFGRSYQTSNVPPPPLSREKPKLAVNSTMEFSGNVDSDRLPPPLPPISPPSSSSAEGAAAAAAAAPLASVNDPTGPLKPHEYPWRKERIAATQAALARIVGNRPPKALSRKLSCAISEAVTGYGMIQGGDRVLVGLSGGKDSMTLLLQLLRLQASAPVWFEVGACTVDPQYEGYDPSPLARWCADLGVPHYFEPAPIMQLAEEHMNADSICAFCSRLKRGLLYAACRREGYNVLALGQHLDDLAESFVMSAFRNGMLRTMKAHYMNDDGDVRIIRPLALCREKDTREYAHVAALPIIPENCPACFSGPTIRYKMKRLLAKEEGENASLFSVLARTMKPLMTSEGHCSVLAAGRLSSPSKNLCKAAPVGFRRSNLSPPPKGPPAQASNHEEESLTLVDADVSEAYEI